MGGAHGEIYVTSDMQVLYVCCTSLTHRWSFNVVNVFVKYVKDNIETQSCTPCGHQDIFSNRVLCRNYHEFKLSISLSVMRNVPQDISIMAISSVWCRWYLRVNKKFFCVNFKQFCLIQCLVVKPKARFVLKLCTHLQNSTSTCEFQMLWSWAPVDQCWVTLPKAVAVWQVGRKFNFQSHSAPDVGFSGFAVTLLEHFYYQKLLWDWWLSGNKALTSFSRYNPWKKSLEHLTHL